jgi:hypothetical protein
MATADVQEKIAAARREAEMLKEKIRAKRDQLADTSRKSELVCYTLGWQYAQWATFRMCRIRQLWSSMMPLRCLRCIFCILFAYPVLLQSRPWQPRSNLCHAS